MVKSFFFVLAGAAMASAAGLSLTIGPPVAAGTGGPTVVKKIGALFAVRLEDCADPSAAQVSATALTGQERAVAVEVAPAGAPGVYLVSTPYRVIEGPPANFRWLVSVTATCGNATAGAIVPVLSLRFDRDHVTLLPHAPSSAELQKALSDAEKRAIVKP